MYYIYINNDNLKYWLEQTNITSLAQCTIIEDFSKWQSMPNEQCIALWETQVFDSDSYQTVSAICKSAKHVILFFPEFINDQWCHEFDLPNVTLFVAGQLNWQPKAANVARHNYFFWSTTDFYHSDQRWLPQISPALPKTKTFDVLLGRQKPHRSLIHQNIDHSKNIVTYFSSDQDCDLRHLADNNFQWPGEILPTPDEEICWTGNEVIVDGTIVSLSQLIPISIYNQTAYSLVAETQYDDQFSFFTEKIIKPMMCKRIFLVCSGQYYLRNLRAWGFQTFDGIVDESYDLEPNWNKRVEMVLKQVKYLENVDQQTIYDRATRIIEHNHQIVMNTPWLEHMIQELTVILLKKLDIY